jgi:hypothetical protein
LCKDRHVVAQQPTPAPVNGDDYGPELAPPAERSVVAGRQRAAAEPAQLGVTLDPQIRDAAVVVSIMPGSAAADAGLVRGDTIEALNEIPIRSPRDIQRVIESMRPGDIVDIDFSRRITGRTQAVLGSGRPATRELTSRGRDTYRMDRDVDQATYEALPSPEEQFPEERDRQTYERNGNDRERARDESDRGSVDRDRERGYRGRFWRRWRR